MNPKPYIPPPWQLPHMLATPVGRKVLIVERCEPQPNHHSDWAWFITAERAERA